VLILLIILNVIRLFLLERINDDDDDEGQGHGASEVSKIALFKVYLLHHLQWELADDHQFLN